VKGHAGFPYNLGVAYHNGNYATEADSSYQMPLNQWIFLTVTAVPGATNTIKLFVGQNSPAMYDITLIQNQPLNAPGADDFFTIGPFGTPFNGDYNYVTVRSFFSTRLSGLRLSLSSCVDHYWWSTFIPTG